MVNNNQSVTIKLSKSNIRQIESLVDTVCDQLFINDTYYGNILVAVTELFNLLIDNNNEKSINITYYSDYKTMTISFQPVDKQVVSSLEVSINLDNFDNDQNSTTIFLIRSLVDNFTIEENSLYLEFDISALHNEIYNHRKSLLKEFFSKSKITDKVNHHND